jgi:amidase
LNQMKAILECSATELSAAIHARKVAPSEVMAAWLAQVQAVNGEVNAIVSLRDPDELMAEARALDDAAPQGWLHGIPLPVKDLVATRGCGRPGARRYTADHVPAARTILSPRGCGRAGRSFRPRPTCRNGARARIPSTRSSA